MALYGGNVMEAPMGVLKIKTRIGSDEFEAEGENEIVLEQYREFKELVRSKLPGTLPPAVTPPAPQPSWLQPAPLSAPLPTAEPLADQGMTAAKLSRIVRTDGNKPLTLSALPRGEGREGDAALILLLAYRILWKEEEMAGARLLDGLQISGYRVERVDRLMDRFMEAQEPLVIRTGVRRGVRYRLTTRGVARATAIIEELLNTIA